MDLEMNSILTHINLFYLNKKIFYYNKINKNKI